MDLNKLPKLFCENVNIGASQEFFVVTLASGEEVEAYAFTPGHAKRFAQSLMYNVSEFEKRFGEIDTKWTPGVQSPMQFIDGGKKGKK